MSSINFNANAQTALNTLRGINEQLSGLNDQISTGKRVNNARDNAAIFSISTVIDADVQSFGKVQESLSLASSTLGVARNATESIVELLKNAQGLIVDAQGKSDADRLTIQADIDNVVEQVGDIVNAASFNGINLVDNSQGASIDFLSSLNRTESGVNVDTITLNTSDLRTTAADTTGATAAAFADFEGILVTNGTDAVVGNFTSGTGVGAGSEAAAALADGQVESVEFRAEIIDAGDVFRLSLSVASADDIQVEFVASEGDTSNDIVLGLQDQLQTALATAGYSTADISISTQTSSRPTDNTVSLSITNNTGSAFNAVTAYNELEGATAGGQLGALRDLDVSTSDTTATAALNSIDDLIEAATASAASFGQAQNRIDTQSNFISSLVDNLNAGISALTDADLTQASADLSRVQTQQQLGLQALAIANQSPQSILALFR